MKCSHSQSCKSLANRLTRVFRMSTVMSFIFSFVVFSTNFKFLEARPRAVNSVIINSNDQQPVVEKLAVEKLLPVDHMDGMKLEQDGMINRDFHKEAFLGNHEEIEGDKPEIAESKLKDIFHKVDSDQDGVLSEGELEAWIADKIQEHFDEALEENDHIFQHLDPDNDGFVKWKEYYVHFLLAKGHPLDKSLKHVVDYDVVEMNFEDKDQLIRYKFRWTDADVDPVDNQLNKKEFLAFRHPEQSSITLENMLRTILNTLDKNGDEKLTELEFTSLPVGEVEEEDQKNLDREWQNDRRNEFRKSIDFNGDGVATKEELMKYMDPRNPEQARSEAQNLVRMLDEDKDGRISIMEMLKNKDIFIKSKCVEIGESLHDEF